MFTKAVTTVAGPYDDVVIDGDVTAQVDWEVELGVVIGRAGKNIGRERALDHVFGFVALNDVSARDIQFGWGGQYFKGKSLIVAANSDHVAPRLRERRHQLEVLECMRPRPAGRKSVPQQRHAFLSRVDQGQHACRLSQLDDLVWIVRSRHPKAISPIEAKRNQPHLTQILTAPRRRV